MDEGGIMSLTLNIGLEHPRNSPEVQCANTFWDLRLLFPAVGGVCPYHLEGRNATDDGLEATIIVHFPAAPEDWRRTVSRLAQRLEQEAIAFVISADTGHPRGVVRVGGFIGPKAAKWEPFNWDLFIMPKEYT